MCEECAAGRERERERQIKQEQGKTEKERLGVRKTKREKELFCLSICLLNSCEFRHLSWMHGRHGRTDVHLWMDVLFGIAFSLIRTTSALL